MGWFAAGPVRPCVTTRCGVLQGLCPRGQETSR